MAIPVCLREFYPRAAGLIPFLEEKFLRGQESCPFLGSLSWEKDASNFRIGYIGSYARGDWIVGSVVDILVLVSNSEQLFEQRFWDWDVSMLPVPADLLVYTLDEWQHLPKEGRFYRAAME